MNPSHAQFPEIPQLETMYFDGSKNELSEFGHEIDHGSKALLARYEFLRELAKELERDLIDPETSDCERIVSTDILAVLGGGQVATSQIQIVLHPLVYLILEQHLLNLKLSLPEMHAITNFIAETIDPEALGGESACMSDVDVFFTQTRGMEFTAGIFSVVKKMIDSINLYRAQRTTPLCRTAPASFQ